MHKVGFHVLSSPLTKHPLLCALSTPRHFTSPPPHPTTRAKADGFGEMRNAWVSAVASIHKSDKAQLARAAERSLRDFLFLASSKQKTRLVAMDAVGIIKLCRKSSQPSRIAEIWPHIKQLSLLPAKDDNTSSALIGSVVSSALEARDTATAASVWVFLRSSSPRLPLAEAHVSQLLSALRGRPDLVVDVVLLVFAPPTSGGCSDAGCVVPGSAQVQRP